MNIPKLLFFKKIKTYFSIKRTLSFWYRFYKVLFFICFLIVLGIGGWNWYYSLYRYHLSDEEKRIYTEQNFKETTFKEAEFRNLVNALVEQARVHTQTITLERNIFEGKGIKIKKQE
ncbi:MAG TPA: hypothetical protein VJH89_03370 [Patescibacteria group bacterium]|nr:hypothetical protein [Patescibacteria group bacterium]